MNLLYDFYSTLLTDKQKEYVALYYADDLSLSEISEEMGVSRQAVYDNIKRSEALLQKYEHQLQLVAQFEKRQKSVAQLLDYVSTRYPDDTLLVTKIEAIENGE